jgi:succinate dehydrogenase hydrophobic anchor subunit
MMSWIIEYFEGLLMVIYLIVLMTVMAAWGAITGLELSTQFTEIIDLLNRKLTL